MTPAGWGERLEGLLLGAAVADAVALPSEGIGPARLRRLWGGEWRHRLVLGRGMFSDDTEHTLFVAQALLAHPADAERFQRALAWKLRFWLASLPAGVGLATGRAIVKLWLGFPARLAGVRSAGNGPAMRSAVIGGYFHDDAARRLAFTAASATLTHSDERAVTGALAVAECAARAVRGDRPELHELRALAASTDAEWPRLLDQMTAALGRGASVSELAAELTLARGIGGYVYHTVPMALFAWLRHRGDYRTTLTTLFDCGGDTDTVGAIAGALAGADAGVTGIPAEWRDGIVDWPRSLDLLRRVARRLAEQKSRDRPLGAVRYAWPLLPLRNALFLAIVLVHGFRRLLPPY